MQQTEIKESQRVLFSKHKALTAEGFIKELGIHDIYGVVATAELRKKYYCPAPYTVILYENIPSVTYSPLALPQELTLIEEKDYESSDKRKTDFIKSIEDKFNLIRTLYKTEPTQNYLKRDFFWKDRTFLKTNYTIAQLGAWDQDKGTWTSSNLIQYRAACCAFTKTTQDVLVWIPKIWLNYYGYTTYDIIEWFKFLSRCEIGFEYEFLAEYPIPKSQSCKEGESIHEVFRLGERVSELYNDGNTGFLAVRIKGHSAYAMHTYLRFICVRYLYDDEYWNIPGLAMQIKKTIGSKVSHWEALLMAHMYKWYNGYYCLTQNTISDKKIISYVNPFQSVKDVLKKLSVSGAVSMNQSFEYEKRFSQATIEELFADKNYIGLYKYLRTIVPEKQKEKVLEEAC